MSVAGKRVVMLVEEGFEDSELFGPLQQLQDAGVIVTLVGPFAEREYTGKRGGKLTSGMAAGRIRVSDFDALIVPGGYAPDRMRLRHAMVDLVRDACAAGKPSAMDRSC